MISEVLIPVLGVTGETEITERESRRRNGVAGIGEELEFGFDVSR